MKKLLCQELKRALLSPVLWLGACALVALQLFSILLNAYGFQVYTTSFLFYNAPLICIFLSVFTALHIGQDFEVRTINNKILAGYHRNQIYIVEMIIAIVCGVLFMLIDTISALIFAEIKKLPFSDVATFTDVMIYFLICTICITTVSTIFTMIVMLAHSRLLSIAIALILTLFALQLGDNSVSALKQSDYTGPENTIENPLYIDGFKRTATNLHILISPFAQAEYAPDMMFETTDSKQANSLLFKKASYHWEFCIANVLEMILVTTIGIKIFKKQDLK